MEDVVDPWGTRCGASGFSRALILGSQDPGSHISSPGQEPQSPSGRPQENHQKWTVGPRNEFLTSGEFSWAPHAIPPEGWGPKGRWHEVGLLGPGGPPGASLWAPGPTGAPGQEPPGTPRSPRGALKAAPGPRHVMSPQNRRFSRQSLGDSPTIVRRRRGALKALKAGAHDGGGHVVGNEGSWPLGPKAQAGGLLGGEPRGRTTAQVLCPSLGCSWAPGPWAPKGGSGHRAGGHRRPPGLD